MPDVYSTYVPPVGNESADIMFVGEAPGKTEEREREPFVGKSGELLTRYAERSGVRRPKDAFFTNLCKYRPRRNSFKNARGTRELEIGLAELSEEIEKVDPNVIVALGGWPMYYLTGASTSSPGSGSMTYRGSVLPCSIEGHEGRKVFVTMHPAAILRLWKMHPVFEWDIKKATQEANFPEIRYPEYEVLLAGDDASHDNWISNAELEAVVSEMLEADWICVDIETFSDQTMSCCGFADSTGRALVVTFKRTGGWQYVQELLASSVPKTFQYGTYDVTFLKRFYSFDTNGFYVDSGWDEGPMEVRNVGWDTYIAAATLMPEFPRGLDFLASVYTDFPYYKDDRKEWKKDYDLNLLWEYNAKDVIAQFTITGKQQRELAEIWDFEIPSVFAEV